MGRRRGRIRPDGGLIFSSATKARICGLFLLARKRRFHDFFKKRFWKNNLHLRVLNVVIPPRGNPLAPFGNARSCRIRNCVGLRLSGIYDKARIERGECLRKRDIALMETICIDGSRGAAWRITYIRTNNPPVMQGVPLLRPLFSSFHNF